MGVGRGVAFAAEPNGGGGGGGLLRGPVEDEEAGGAEGLRVEA